MTQSADTSPRKWPWVFIVGMSLGTLLGTAVMHGLPSSWEAWSEILLRVFIIVLVTGLVELIRRRLRKEAPRDS